MSELGGLNPTGFGGQGADELRRLVARAGEQARYRDALYLIIEVDDEGRPTQDQRAMYQIASDALGIDSEPDFDSAGDVHDPVQDEAAGPDFGALGEQWADEHRGELYRRPQGVVVYQVRAGDGLGHGGVKVRRSSDGRETSMSVADFDKMIQVTEMMLDDSARALLGLQEAA